MKKIVTIKIEDAEVDMQLAADATDTNGVCMLTVGSTLTAGTISGLKKRNIKEVSIYKHEVLTPEQSQRMIMEIKNVLDHSFKNLHDFPVMNDLKQVFYNFRTKELSENNE